MFSMGLLLVICLGLGALAAVILVIVVVVISRREDFVNPFSNRKTERQPAREASVSATKNVAPPYSFRSEGDQEQALVDWLVSQASAQTGVNLSRDQMVQERIVNAVRNAMQELEGQDEAVISLPFLTADGSGPKHFEMTFTRKMMDQLR